MAVFGRVGTHLAHKEFLDRDPVEIERYGKKVLQFDQAGGEDKVIVLLI